MGYIPGISSFDANLDQALRRGRKVWIVIGTKDEFTSIERFRTRTGVVGVEAREVDGAGHFFRGDGDGPGLVGYMREWLKG